MIALFSTIVGCCHLFRADLYFDVVVITEGLAQKKTRTVTRWDGRYAQPKFILKTAGIDMRHTHTQRNTKFHVGISYV